MTAQDIRDFSGYLKTLTDRQVYGVVEKERGLGENHEAYVELALLELDRRGLEHP